MAKYQIQSPFGEKFEITAPDNASQDEVLAYAQRQFQKPQDESALKNFIGGQFESLQKIGENTVGRLTDALGIKYHGMPISEYNKQQREKLYHEQSVNPEATSFKAGKTAGDIELTMPITQGLAGAASAIPQTAKYAQLLRTGGMDLGGAATGSKVADALLKMGAGATGGIATSELINPEGWKEAGVIGAVMPALSAVGGKIGEAIRGNAVNPEVQQLAKRAEELGVNIPADRLTDSKFTNAIASSLNYVPLSGRSAVEQKMEEQFNRAASRTFGQDSSNITQALRRAQSDLGSKFETTLKNNSVLVDDEFMKDLSEIVNRANKELVPDQAGIIKNQVDDILSMVGKDNKIQGQTAYNIKKTLDKIADRTSSESYYANDLKKKLMAALNRSLGEEKAQEFSTLRQQYGNMLDLQNMAKAGAEGGLSIARVANMRHINNPQLQEIADIAAQFVKPREGQHSAMQRALAGAAATFAAGPTSTGLSIAGARGVNELLKSKFARDFMLNNPNKARELMAAILRKSAQVAPALVASETQGE